MADVPGTDGADHLVGAATNDRLFGGLGDDTLDGGAGNDELYGGQDNDLYLFTGGQGNDLIGVDPGGADDRVLLGAGLGIEQVRLFRPASGFGLLDDLFVVLEDGSGSQLRIVDHFTAAVPSVERLLLAGGDEIDLTGGLAFVGGVGNDAMAGTLYDDTLDGRTGNDTLFGGQGNDTFLFSGGQGNDVIGVDDGGTSDRVLLGDAITIDQVRLVRTGIGFGIVDDLFVVLDDGSGSQLRLDNHFVGAAPSIEKLAFASGEEIDLTAALTITGGVGNDVLAGTVHDDTLSGGAGNDTLFGGQGNDTFLFSGGQGNDLIGADDGGQDRVLLGDGISPDQVRLVRLAAGFGIVDDLFVVIDDGSGGQLRLDNHFAGAAPSIEKLVFADGKEVDLTGALSIRGGVGNDLLAGTIHDDALDGGAGNDSLFGGLGNDTYAFSGRFFGYDVVGEDVAGQADAIRLGQLSLGGVRLAGSGETLLVTEARGASRVAMLGQYDEDGPSIEKLLLAGGVSLDLTRGQGFRGSANGEAITGTRFADTVIGGAGNDELRGGGGKDTYVFGPGWGSDRILDNEGLSTLVFEGLSRADLTIVDVGLDRQIIRPGSPDKLILAGFANGPAPRIVFREEGEVSGIVFGSGGDDVLRGTRGGDVLKGGGGLDRFLFRAAADSPARDPDTILDFRSGDVIDLAGFDADRTTPGRQSFDYIGGRVFSGTAGELRFRNSVLEGDIDGDGDAELVVVLANFRGLGAEDLILG